MNTDLAAPHTADNPQYPPSPTPGNQITHFPRGAVPIINGRINGHLVFEMEPAYQYAPADICRQWQRRGWSRIALETGVALHGLNAMIDTLNAVVAADCQFCETRKVDVDDWETISLCGLHEGEFK